MDNDSLRSEWRSGSVGNNTVLHDNTVPHDNTVLHDNNALHNNTVPHDNTVLHDNNVLHDNIVLHDNNVLHDNFMSSSPHSSDSDIENTFSSTNILNYFPASPRNVSPESSDDFTKYLIASPTLSLFHNDPYMKVMQAYDAMSLP
ncbi:reverse transcriptase domain-containing protein [Tanacetum coccineum]